MDHYSDSSSIDPCSSCTSSLSDKEPSFPLEGEPASSFRTALTTNSPFSSSSPSSPSSSSSQSSQSAQSSLSSLSSLSSSNFDNSFKNPYQDDTFESAFETISMDPQNPSLLPPTSRFPRAPPHGQFYQATLSTSKKEEGEGSGEENQKNQKNEENEENEENEIGNEKGKENGKEKGKEIGNGIRKENGNENENEIGIEKELELRKEIQDKEEPSNGFKPSSIEFSAYNSNSSSSLNHSPLSDSHGSTQVFETSLKSVNSRESSNPSLTPPILRVGILLIRSFTVRLGLGTGGQKLRKRGKSWKLYRAILTQSSLILYAGQVKDMTD